MLRVTGIEKAELRYRTDCIRRENGCQWTEANIPELQSL